MDLTTGLLLLLTGIIAGGYGTIVGVGGGFILVPTLLIVFDMEPVVAAGSGLVIVFINSLSGVFGYARKRKINYKTGLTLGIGALPGSLTGVWLLQIYSSTYFYFIFASILVCLGVFLFLKNPPNALRRKVKAQSDIERNSKGSFSRAMGLNNSDHSIQTKWLLPLGFMMGVVSSYLGIGGGWLLVPILIYLFRIPAHNATATSIFSLCLYSLVGVFFNLFYSNIDWMTVLSGGFGVIIGSQIGVISSSKVPGKVIIQMLSIMLIIIGVRMYFN